MLVFVCKILVLVCRSVGVVRSFVLFSYYANFFRKLLSHQMGLQVYEFELNPTGKQNNMVQANVVIQPCILISKTGNDVEIQKRHF